MRLPFNPRNHIFKTAGAAAGMIALGLFGLIFGFIGGALVDQLTAGLRQKNLLRRFFSNPAAAEGSRELKLLTPSAGAAVIWYFCSNEPARLEIASAALPVFFPEAPRYCGESLSEHPAVNYESAAVFFGNNADENQKTALGNMLRFCGLERTAARKAAGNAETARILAASGYKAEPASSDEPESEEADFTILGLAPDAAPEEIKKQYHMLAAHFHPDAGAQLSPEQQRITEDAFKRIQAAYERLSGS
ncbi:MAG TPA: hypothetical protein DCO79_15135 [Spirochaeta sp.]|nr:hypothetical protein [Spirochaeta sp.]